MSINVLDSLVILVGIVMTCLKPCPQENIFEFFIVQSIQIITINVSKDDSFLIFNPTST